MRVIVFGGTGGTGLELLRQLLAAGHSTTAYVRTPSKLTPSKLSKLPSPPTIITGDVRDAAAVAAALRPGFDAVMLALGGAGIMRADDTCSVGTAHVLAALAAAGQRPKVIVCSSMGVRETRSHIPAFVRWLLKHPLADKDIQEAAVEASGLPFCIVRPTGLRDAPARGMEALAAVATGATPTSGISRADVAAFMIAQLADGAPHANKCVGISWRQ